ncbi:MAG: DUF6796 family protein [Eubacteriales bacterium]
MHKKDNRYLYFILGTAAACLLALTGDLLIGWVEPGSLGKYGMIQAGWPQVAIWRPTLSLILASIAFPFYLPGLYAVSKRIEETSPGAGRVFLFASFASSTGWLLIHAAFCIPQFAFKYIYDAGYPDLAVKLTDKMLEMTVPSVIVSSLLMITAFGVLFVVIVRSKTVYGRWFVLMNPLVVAPATILLAAIFPDSIFFAGLNMCKMNLGMFLFFLVAAVYEYKRQDRETRHK